MRKTLFVLFIGILLCAGMTVSPVAPHPGSSSPRTFPPGRPAQVPDLKPQPTGNPSGLHLDFGSLPLYFTANRGQVDGRALFYAKAARYTLWLTEEGLVFDSFKSERAEAPSAGKEPYLRPEKRGSRGYERDVSRLVFLNAAKHPEIVPVDETALKVNYFIGNDPAKWHTAVPTSGAVLYRNIYDRIDLKVYGIESRIEYDWIVRPGGNPRDIRFEYRNMKGMRVDEAGNLLVETGFGELVHKKPAAYQEAGAKLSVEGRSGNGTRVAVESAFKRIGENAYGFEVGAYDAGLELVIDPVVLAYSTYLGGNSDDYGQGIAVDGSGNAYVTGYTLSTNFPTLNQYQTDKANTDVFVTKIDTTKSGNDSLVYSTYLGGSSQDYGYGIAVDGSGNAYVTGYTNSTDFPTLNQYQTDPGDGNWDVFVTKIDTTKSGNDSLVYSTYLGGNSLDYGWGIAVDGSGNAYVTGETHSTNFPTLNQYQTDQASLDAFVTKIDTTKSGNDSLVYSTYLGGNDWDIGYGIAVDGSGNAYVIGYTASTDFPTLNQYQTDQAGDDVFVTKLDTTKSGNDSLVYSTYLGGSDYDSGTGIAVDGSGNAYVTGYTYSTNFPTLNQYQTDQASTDAFVTKIDTTKSGNASLVYSTYLGGSNVDEGYGIAVDGSGNAYVTGDTASTDFPTLNQYQTDQTGWDAFIAKISADIPTVTTTAVSDIAFSTATSGGNVTAEGGAAVTARGVCWSTSANPTTADSKTTDGSGSGGFTSSITGLTSSTTYHVRAYATNAAGTSYGDDLTFGTSASTFTISGKMTDGPNPVQYVTVTFSHDGHTESTAANGTYSYTVPRGTTTTVTPSHAAYPSWTPASRTITNITADQPNQDFQGTPIMYRISGTVTDGTNPVGGVTITFSFYGHTETTAADGTYSYNMPPYSSTSITPSKTGYGSWTPAVRELAHIASDEPNQDFQGTNLTAPRMTLVQGQTTIPKGGTYDYGMQMVNAGSQAVFTINNTGPSDLTLQTNLVINGANADQFSVIQAPTSPVAPNQSTTFIIEFKATSVGQKTASISLLNNDPVNNPYDLNLQGKGETSLAFVYSGSWTGAGKAGAGWFIGDFNGDGKKDIFRYYPGVSGADMFLSDGTQFNSVGSWTGAGYGSDGWYVGDFNGDGRSDIFRYLPGVSGADMFLSDGTQFNSVGSWTGAGYGSDGWYVGDFNGDGKDDIMRYTPGMGSEVFLSDGTQFVSAGIWTGAGYGSDGWYVGDFNGDGKDDIMRYIPSIGSEVFLSDGTQFVSAGIWTGAGNGADGWYVGDFNGDGKDDIMRYTPGVGSEVFLSYGTQFVSAGIWTGAGNGADGWYVGDFNGDGMDDIFRYLPGVSGADVFLAGSVSGSVSEFDAFQSNASSSVGILFDAAYWRMEEKWLEPFRQKAARGEFVSLMDLKQAYENATGGKPTRAVLLRWLKKHDFRLISKE
jgi:hypothetical protein